MDHAVSLVYPLWCTPWNVSEYCYKVLAKSRVVLLPIWFRNHTCKSYLHISTEIILRNKSVLSTELPHTFICQKGQTDSLVNCREGTNYYNKKFVLVEL